MNNLGRKIRQRHLRFYINNRGIWTMREIPPIGWAKNHLHMGDYFKAHKWCEERNLKEGRN